LQFDEYDCQKLAYTQGELLTAEWNRCACLEHTDGMTAFEENPSAAMGGWIFPINSHLTSSINKGNI